VTTEYKGWRSLDPAHPHLSREQMADIDRDTALPDWMGRELTPGQASKIKALFAVIYGRPKIARNMLAVLRYDLQTMPWEEIAESIKSDGGLEPEHIEELRQIIYEEAL
jgi:hypothetical protein